MLEQEKRKQKYTKAFIEMQKQQKKMKTANHPTNVRISNARRRLHDILKSCPKGFNQKCQVCLQAEEDESNWIGCDQCWRWYHCCCVNNYNFNASFYCHLCS